MEPTNEIVQPEWTNASLATLLFNEIILHQWTNINNKNDGDITPEIVHQVWNIAFGYKSRPVAKYIHEQVVFTVSAIPRTEKLGKSNVYRVINELIKLEIVEKTLFYAQNPDPSYTGPKARFYKLSGVDLSDGWNSPLLKRAQAVYEASLYNSPEYEQEQSNKTALFDISPVVVDYFKPRIDLLQGPTGIGFIRDYIKKQHPNMDPEMVSDLAIRVRHEVLSEGSA